MQAQPTQPTSDTLNDRQRTMLRASIVRALAELQRIDGQTYRWDEQFSKVDFRDREMYEATVVRADGQRDTLTALLADGTHWLVGSDRDDIEGVLAYVRVTSA